MKTFKEFIAEHKITQLTSSAGVAYKSPSAKVHAKFKELGGSVGRVSDKSVDLHFPHKAAADEFKKFAQATDGKHAQFDEDDRYESLEETQRRTKEGFIDGREKKGSAAKARKKEGTKYKTVYVDPFNMRRKRSERGIKH